MGRQFLPVAGEIAARIAADWPNCTELDAEVVFGEVLNVDPALGTWISG